MKYLGHYLIHHTGWMDAALELGMILDEQNIAREHRYTITNEIEVPSTRIAKGCVAGVYEDINRVDGMDFYKHLEPDVRSHTHGLGAYFTWELSPIRGYTLTDYDRSARIYDVR